MKNPFKRLPKQTPENTVILPLVCMECLEEIDRGDICIECMEKQRQ